MVHPTYKKQNEITKKIRSYLGPAGESGKTWAQLFKKATADRISKTTLSRYLKNFEKQGVVIREVRPESRPPIVLYRLNQPRPISGRKVNLEQQLLVYEKYASEGQHGAMGYYDKFIWILFDMIAIHVWASRFRNPKIAAEWIRAMTETTLAERYDLGQEVPVLMKHRGIVQDSARDYLTWFLRRFPKGRPSIAELLEPGLIEKYLAFDPHPGIRAMA
jgi:hypothetical protein